MTGVLAQTGVGGLDRVLGLLIEELSMVLAAVVFVGSVVLGLFLYRGARRLLVGVGVEAAVEGTPFERTARRFGSSTVSLLATLAGVFVVLVGTVVALRIAEILSPDLFSARLTGFLPNLFVAVVVAIVGLIAGDKAELATSERLRSVKLPEVTVIPTLVKYSIVFAAFLVAFAQLGVAVTALLVLLAAYTFGLFFVGGLAFKDMLSSIAAGIYLLLSEPYSIGDEVEIDGRRGVVQEVDVLVTRIENGGEEYVLPNRLVFESGIVRVRP
jgi:small-conductance mechanosensitive channel